MDSTEQESKVNQTTNQPTKEKLDILETTEIQVPEVKVPEPTDWNGSIIGRLEKLLQKRIGTGPMWPRLAASTLVSVALHNVILYDKTGPVTPSLWGLYIGPSGLANKTPLLRRIKEIATEFNPEYLGPTRFSIEGFIQHISGSYKLTKEEEEEEQERVKPKTTNFLVRDEMSRLLGESKGYQYMNTIQEFMSELWDGETEGYATRKMRHEGGVKVYVSLLSASSNKFYKMLEEDFFEQGLGCRLLYVNEKPPKPEMDPDDYFESLDSDDEWTSLKQEIVSHMKIMEKLEWAYPDPDANKMWREFRFAIKTHIYNKEEPTLLDLYRAKEPINALKLAIIYAASQYSFALENGRILVRKEHMEQAIRDIKIYDEMFRRVLSEWNKRRVKREQGKMKSSKYDLLDIINLASRQGGLITVPKVETELDLTDTAKITKILDNGTGKEWFEAANVTNENGNLTQKEIKIVRSWSTRGRLPVVYRLTEEGRKTLES